MSNDQPDTIQFLLPPANINRDGSEVKASQTLPRVLGGGYSRSAADDAHNLFINERTLQVDSVFDLSGAGRSAVENSQGMGVNTKQLVTLEATDGTTLIMRADKLQQDLQRLYPGEGVNADKQVNIRVLTDQEAAARGLGDWIWSRLSLLRLSPDGIVETAKDKALELLKEKLGENVEELIAANVSHVGAKALMWAIESRLVGEPGLYRWHEKDLYVGDVVKQGDADLQKAAENDEPVLLFIHGTASSTVNSFGGLHEGTVDEGGWEKLTRGFAGRVYGFEHYTFSDSPLENALHLARTLPKGARLSLITHSRGGLIGDLLCMGEYDDDLISRYQREPVLETEGEFEGQERPENKKLREKIVAEEKEQLRTLRGILREKQFRIERYVRVAAPASGTTLLAENLDVFLSGLLSLVNFAVGLIPAVGTMGSTVLSAFRRIVLEIAEKRIDPRLIPGIEAMLPNSPLTIFIAQAPRADGIDMAIVSGTVDGDSGNFFKRIAVMLTDWIIFDQFDNDFVVDTQSMRAGLVRRNQTREFYAHGHQVNHLRYFDRHDSRRAIYKWITDPKPQELPMFHPVPTDFEVKLDQFGSSETEALRGEVMRDKDAPLVVYLPGVMGSHLEIRKGNRRASEGDRVWFDPFHLTMGGIAQLSIDKENVLPEGIFRRYYGDLETYLQREHEVVTFAYDWRHNIADTADLLAEVITDKLESIKDQPHRQLSILAHSMGGLVVRTMIARHPELWEQVVTRTGGHFVMMGTPNHGSHQTVENLMGKSSAIRQLAMLDFQHGLQEIIDIVAGFDGVLQLLPPNEFADTGVEHLPEQGEQQPLSYLLKKDWETIRSRNRDRWFGAKLGPVPENDALARARELWGELLKQDKDFPHAEKVAYVYGLDGHTPCGVVHDASEKCLHLMGTAQGDGSVSWKSGYLPSLSRERYWYMPVSHASLTNSREYFPAIVELLRKGSTQKLDRKAPRTRSATGRSYRYDAGPGLQPGAEDLVLSFFGGRPMRESTVDETQLLEVSVRAMDLRFAQQPLMCGHYRDDSIAGAESLIDYYLVKGALTQRERLGIYAGELGSNTIVLNPRSAEERKRGSGRGAIIVGLGEWEKITVQELTNTVRDAALQFLLQSIELSQPVDDGIPEQEEALTLNSLLIGHNSTTHITVDASIEAIVLAICEANQQYRHNKSKQQPARAIRKLEFIEYYMDTAISAAYAVRELPTRLEKDLLRFDARVVPAAELQYQQGDGARERLSNRGHSSGYWSRLMVLDAEERDEQCPESCYEKWLQPAMPQKVRDALEKQLGTDQAKKNHLPALETAGVAERLKYVYLSERARAEALVQQRQPGLIEALIKKSIRDSNYDPDICRTLFQLMVPLDFKPAARQTQQLLMVLDGYTANLPWEMLQADDEPLALKIAMVRQLVSSRYRKSVTGSLNKSACVIGNPSTADFHHYFDMGLDIQENEPASLASLEGATDEAQRVTNTLKNSGYEVETLFPKQVSDEPSHTAIQVFNTLFKKPYRILMIAAHGEVNVMSRRDGKRRTGVVLSDGVMLTAAEIGQMEVVPDLVFLNCCHLSKLDNSVQNAESSSYNRLAYSVSRELIEMGVRCVIAAGWAVNDSAANTFSTHFFECFTSGQPFGKAVWEARKKTHEMHLNLNTWGAYQAYGDPNYVLDTDQEEGANANNWMPVAPQELTSELKRLQVNMRQSAFSGGHLSYGELVDKVDRLLKRVPEDWVRRPGIQYQLAELYGDMLPESFERAEAACLQAIIHEDKEGHVPIKALELLGNLEAKQAEKLSEQAQDNWIASKKTDIEEKKRKELLKERTRLLVNALHLADSAIERLQGLLKITHDMHELSGNVSGIKCDVNAERFALLGSALKRKAMVLIRHENKSWKEIRSELEECRKFYAQGEDVTSDDHFNPYLTINRLQLDGVLGNSSAKHLELAKKSRAVARQQFSQSLDFFAGVMAADAVVAIYLLDEAAFEELLGDKENPKTFLISTFTDAVNNLQHSVSEFKSVTKQLEGLSIFLRKRAEAESEREALLKRQSRVLSEVAAALKKF
ncbi:MAG: DUF7379 domain-containing protein [Thiolinea sp.]